MLALVLLTGAWVDHHGLTPSGPKGRFGHFRRCQDPIANAITLIRGRGHSSQADILDGLYSSVPPKIIDDGSVNWGRGVASTDIRLNMTQYALFTDGMTCAQKEALFAADLYHELYHYQGGDDYSYTANDCAIEESENGNECLYYDSVYDRENMHRNYYDDTYDP